MSYTPGSAKISDIQTVTELVGKIPGKKVVLTGGVFDFLKPYHIDLFNFAKDRSDILVVAVEFAGEYTPVEERLEILEAVENIDYLFTYSDESDLNKIGELVSEVIFNDEFELPRDKISFIEKVIRFLP
ncbi:MAG: hypothetical protein KAR14_07785 [Candidatus Aminicenantes bacterium]|nr:hypothetical protein [Candidatus Aminicenantes bacterium]